MGEWVETIAATEGCWDAAERRVENARGGGEGDWGGYLEPSVCQNILLRTFILINEGRPHLSFSPFSQGKTVIECTAFEAFVWKVLERSAPERGGVGEEGDKTNRLRG